MNDNHKFWQAGNMQIDEMEAAEGKIPPVNSCEVETIALPVDALQGGWIRIEDDVPDNNINVLGYFGDDEKHVVNHVDGDWVDALVNGIMDTPSHWMPLPDAPLMDIKD